MGADIHLVVERRIEPGKWVAVRIMLHGFNTASRGQKNDLNYAWPAGVERNYDRFAALAGVRGDGPAAKGLPDDASDTARLLLSHPDYHSQSWLELEEAGAVFVRTELFPIRDHERKYPEYHYFNIEEETDGAHAEHRVVFAFDN